MHRLRLTQRLGTALAVLATCALLASASLAATPAVEVSGGAAAGAGPTGATGPTGGTGPTGPMARMAADGRRAIPPKEAPLMVKRAIRAANRLTKKPYRYGGGHARFYDRAYDCSGAVSFVLRAIGRVDRTMVSGEYKRWGLAGAGKWITVYANEGHVFMVVAGLRFDTSGWGESGPRWRPEPRWMNGFVVRHPARM